MTRASPRFHTPLNFRWRFFEKGVEIEGAGEHGEGAGGGAGPGFLGAVPIEFDAVAIGVAKVKSFADAVIRGAFEGDSSFDEAAQGVGEFGASGIKNGEMIKASGASGRWRSAGAFPGVEANMMVIAASGKEGGLVAIALGDFKSEDVAIEG